MGPALPPSQYDMRGGPTLTTENEDTQNEGTGSGTNENEADGRYWYDFPRPAVAVDIALTAFLEQDLKILLIKRRADPFAGQWALPGGFVEIDEPLEAAAQRELREETGVRPDHLEQLRAFGKPDRDPRGRIISVAFIALARPETVGSGSVQAADDAADARWWALNEPPQLAFDHDEVLEHARTSLRLRMGRDSVAQSLLPAEFTLSMLQKLHESVFDTRLDKRNFRRKYLDKGILVPTGNFSTGEHRPARLYRFTMEAGGST